MVNEQFERMERGVDIFLKIVVDIVKINILLGLITSYIWVLLKGLSFIINGG